MEQTVKVVGLLPDGRARVIRVRESACSGECHKCSGCGAAKQTVCFTAENPVAARVGDTVTVCAASAPVLAAATVLYLLPLLLFFAGYIGGAFLGGLGGLLGAAGFLAGIGLAIGYDRRIRGKREIVYTITGFSA